MITKRWSCAVTFLILTTAAAGCSAQPKRMSAGDTAPAQAEAAPSKLTTRLDSILHRRDDGKIVFGARVIELKTGRELYAHDLDRPLMPASNMKLPVSSTGLDFFGPDHVFETYLAMDGEDLWLIGTGDPATGDPAIAKANNRTTMTMLDEWADALKKKGIRRIKGRLMYYDLAFDDQLIHPSWSKSFAGDWYAAPLSGLNFNDNCVDVKVTPTKAGELVKYTVVPPTKGAKFINECKTGGTGKPDIKRDPEANVYRITGSATQPTDLPSTSVIDPGAFFADALRTHLESKGIRIEGSTKRADLPLDGRLEPSADKLIATHETKMTDVMWRINKNSQNLFAEAMCKAVGRAWKAKHGDNVAGSWSAGAQAVKDFLNRNKIDTSYLVVTDGSGLSRDNRVTVRIISDLLVTMNKHQHRDAFRASLSIAGKDGTLRNRMKDITPAFIGKTGYIGGVRSLSGYVKTRSGEDLVVSVIFNGFSGSVRPFEELQDEVVRTLVEYPNVPDHVAQPATAPSEEK
jgi:D-alanyl-D-alanine carboxypeptidase/D-alanyl-D-alanine-endopeptidase (penicillin-binding protein 4)